MESNSSFGDISYFEEIDPPFSRKRKNVLKMLKGSMLIAVVVISLSIGGYFYFRPKYDASDSSATITGFSRIEVDGDTQTFGLEVEIFNPSNEPFKIESADVDLSIQNVTMNGLPDGMWVKIAENLVINTTYQINAKGARTISLEWTIDSSDDLGIQFLYMILMHQNHTIKIEGSLEISLDSPNHLSISSIVRAKDLFDYEVTDDKTTHLLKNNDLISVPVDGVVDTTTNISFMNRYINPFDFPITLIDISYDITNQTTKTWGSYKLPAPIEIPGNDYLNMSIMGSPKESEITQIISDLLSGAEDIFLYKNINVSFDLGDGFIINGYKSNEIVKGEYTLTLEVAGYNLIGSEGLTLDIEFVNPCGFQFNLSYIEIDIFIAGTHQTQKAIWLHDTVAVDPYSYVPVRAYGTTRVDSISVDVDFSYVDNVLGGAQVDYVGFLSADCFQYLDDIPFVSLNQNFLSDEEE